MFLVEKAISSSSSPFKSKPKKSHLIKSYQLAAISLDQKISHHLKITIPATSSLSFTYLSSLISVLTSVHTECESQISNVNETGSGHEEMLGLYMDYSLKVLDLCNLMTSSLQKFTEKRMLINFGVKLLMMMNNNDKCQVVQVEKMNKATEVFGRAVNGFTESSPEKMKDSPEYSPEKGKSARKLIDELTVMIGRLPEVKTVKNGRDLVARAFYALGLLTVVIGDVLVSVLFGEDSERVKVRVPAEFMWCDSVNELQKVNGSKVLEVDDVVKQAVIVRELIDNVTDDAEGRVKLVEGVKEMEMKVKRFSDGVDAMNDGVDGLFRTVLKTRNGRLGVKF